MREYASGAEMRAAYAEIRGRLMGPYAPPRIKPHKAPEKRPELPKGRPKAEIPFGAIFMGQQIIVAACEAGGLTKAEMIGPSHALRLAFVRKATMYLMRRHTVLSTVQIGRMLNRDHSTIVHGVDSVANSLDKYKPLLGEIASILNQREKAA